MHHAGANTMEMDDFGGAAWGGLGGLVRWFRDREGVTSYDRLLNVVSSTATAIGFGHLMYQAMVWACPNVPKTLCAAIAFVPGIGSGILLQWSMKLVSGLAEAWHPHLMAFLGPRAKNGPPAAPAGPATGVAVTTAVVVGDRLPAGPVPGVDGGQRVAEGKAERPTSPAGG